MSGAAARTGNLREYVNKTRKQKEKDRGCKKQQDERTENVDSM